MRRSFACVAFALVAASTAHAGSPRALLALDCENLTVDDVRSTLADAEAPRIIALHGSVPIVDMGPFATFLEKMGYPREKLRLPGAASPSNASFVDSRRIAGYVAWLYEREGLMPMLIGHSQGGMIVIKVLHDLASKEPIAVWDPRLPAPEARTTIADPFTGEPRDVTSLKVHYAAALATGSLPRVLLGQWGMLPLLRDVPDSVVDFTGFAIPYDPIAGTGREPTPFRATGTASVRNVVLPATTSHIGMPRVAHLADARATRAWIEAYRPGTSVPLPAEADTANLLHAADIWYDVKRHWCLGAQRIAQRRNALR
ncbi:MAG TPA: hypothetical protein VNE58_16870 [Casimicrobiaceae bacterium]|nr:hypothetical protein [Casimicrobiaceae bacterium]